MCWSRVVLEAPPERLGLAPQSEDRHHFTLLVPIARKTGKRGHENEHCALWHWLLEAGSWGGQRPSLADYVRCRRATERRRSVPLLPTLRA